MESSISPSPLDSKGLCLLSLDGGGVRGLSSLLILRDLMTQLNAECEGSTFLKPCDVFDLIGGTSTGGLIAIMLGRLEMDVDECIIAYIELMKSIFSEKMNKIPVDWSGNIQSQYDSKKLKRAIENVINRAGLCPTDLMNDGKLRRAKVFVCTTSKDTLQVTRLRSYDVPNETTLPATICEAALATSAATLYFDSVTIGSQQFVDGAFGANNPIEEVEEEAADIWCTASRALKPLVKCFVSVGTGNPARVPIDDNVLKFLSKTLVKMATKPESTERRFMARWSNEIKGKRCFRFNVEQGLQQVHMTEFEKRNVIESATYAYLHHSSQKSNIRDCIKNLSTKEGKTDVDFEATIRKYGARIAHNRILEHIHTSSNALRRRAPWVVPFERNPRYVDRAVVGKVKRRLFVENRPERIAIFGLGGVGKTQISLELAFQTKELYPDCAVFWLPAIDMESIQHAYQMVADQLGIVSVDTDEDVKTLVKNHLSEPVAGRWLLIFDNADDIDMWTGSKESTLGGLRSYLPKNAQGAIIFTTRSNKVAQYLAYTDIIEVPELDERRATDVLRNCLIKKELLHDINSTQKLLGRLTFLPLAIIQAASFINENSLTINGYVELLDGQEQSTIDLLSEDFEDQGRYKSIRNPVATTWLTSFVQILRQDRLAADYLSFMACIKEKDIPISILPWAPELEQKRAIGLLSSYSFVRVRHQDSRLDMHRLVHLATRNWHQSGNYLQRWQLHVLRHMDLSFPQVDRMHRPQWRVALPHALHILDLTAREAPLPERASLLDKVGTCQRLDGRYKQCEKQYTEAIKIWGTLQDAENPSAILTLSGLALAYSSQGKLEKAIRLCEKIIEIQKRLHGHESLETNRALFLLAFLYNFGSSHEKARELCRQVIPHYIKALGPGHGDTMLALHTLNLTYVFLGQLSDAAKLSMISLNLHRRLFGSDHPQTLNVMSALAVLHLERWRLKEAEALFTEVLKVRTRLFGPEYPETLFVMGWLASTLESRGRRRDSLAMRTEGFRLSAQAYGPDHVITRDFCSQLEECTKPKRTINAFMYNHFSGYRGADSMLQRRRKYPKVKVYGLYHVKRQPKNDPLLREIEDAIKGMSIDRQVSSGGVTLIGGQGFEEKPLAALFQHPKSSH